MDNDGGLALVLSGGGARAAYQVGALRGIAERAGSGASFPIVTGVSAGAINAAGLASGEGSLDSAVSALERYWLGLSIGDVFRSGLFSLLRSSFKWACILATGGRVPGLEVRGLLDTRPLRETLSRYIRTEGIDANLSSGKLRALALSALRRLALVRRPVVVRRCGLPQPQAEAAARRDRD